ncbi:hypothetical protein ACFWHL_38045 [Streptomyces massasporeus]
MATVCAALHRRAGEDPVTGTGVAGLRGTAAVTGEGRLTDGRTVRADVVIAGIGAAPNTAWLVGLTLALRDGTPTTTVA